MSRTAVCVALNQLHDQGFDEFMNVVLDDAEEVWVKVSKKADGEASSNGRVKREYGDRKPLGEYTAKSSVAMRCAYDDYTSRRTSTAQGRKYNAVGTGAAAGVKTVRRNWHTDGAVIGIVGTADLDGALLLLQTGVFPIDVLVRTFDWPSRDPGTA